MKPIHLIPLGNGSGPPEPGLDVLEHLAATLARTFRTPCRIRPEPFDLSFALRCRRGGQYHSTAILQRLERATDPASRVLGVTACDLYVPVLTFVFGEAQLDGNCAVVSTARLHEEFYGLPPREDLLRERLVKEAVHELGHTFGLRHCPDWRCVMASSHGVERLDVKGAEFCQSCRKPIQSDGTGRTDVPQALSPANPARDVRGHRLVSRCGVPQALPPANLAARDLMRRIQVRVRGIVQGVGFRPFVYNLARRLRLGGLRPATIPRACWSKVEGEAAALEAFLDSAARTEHPPLAWVQDSSCDFPAPRRRCANSAFARASPRPANSRSSRRTSPPAPTAWREFRDPANRRYGYPFTNCTNCGPRYTIIRDIPYDRARHHHGGLRDVPGLPRGVRRSRRPPLPRPAQRLPGLRSGALGAGWREAQRRLAAGEILAIKGLGGFHLACDARNAAAVRRLRARKRRSDKPFAVMVARSGGGARTAAWWTTRAAGALTRSAPPHRDPAAARRRGTARGDRARQSDAGRDAALHAAASPAVPRRARSPRW